MGDNQLYESVPKSFRFFILGEDCQESGEHESQESGEHESQESGKHESQESGEHESQESGEHESQESGEHESQESGEHKSQQSGFNEMEKSKLKVNSHVKDDIVIPNSWKEYPYEVKKQKNCKPPTKKKFDKKTPTKKKFDKKTPTKKKFDEISPVKKRQEKFSRNRRPILGTDDTNFYNADNTCMVGLSISAISHYREIHSTECKPGNSCLRHADIPGLKISHKKSKKCSSLEVELTKATGETRYDVKVHNLYENVIPNNVCEVRAPNRNMTFPAGPKNTPVKFESVSTSSKETPSYFTTERYGCDKSLIDSVTPLLHAQEFGKIVGKVDAYLEGKSDSEALIPPLFVVGLSLFKLAKYDIAKERLLRCDEICLASGKPGDSALCHLYLGDSHFSSRHFLDAANHYKNATSRYSSVTVATLFRMVPPSLSAVHAKHGSSLRNASKMIDAVQEYKLAIKEAKTDKDKLAANTSLGNLYQSMGENSSALTHYQQSIEISEKLHDYVSLGWAHGNMGNAYLGLFQKDKALFHLQKSLELTLEYEPVPQAIGRTYNNLGTAYQSLGDLDKAQEQYDHAHSQAVYGNDKAGQARVCGNMGNVLMLRKIYEEAIPKYSEVLQLSKDRSTLSTARHNRGCAYYEWGEFKMQEKCGDQEELQGLSEALSSIEGLTKGRVLMAKFYIYGSEFKDVSDHQPRDVPNNIAAFYKKGYEDLQEVVKFHETHLDNIKGSSKGLTLSVSLFETNSRTFHRLQDCLVNLGQVTKALLIAEQSRARTLGELMLKRKGWCLQDPLTSPMPFEQIVATVGSSAHPILYLSYTGARLLGWVFIPKQDTVTMNMFEVPLKDDQFDGKSLDYHLRYSLTEALVERSFEMYREVGDYDEETSAPVQSLYNLIAKPLVTILEKSEVSGTQKIVVITDSYTALLPFSCLHDSKSDVFLGDRYCFQLMPSFLTMNILNQLSDINVVNLPTDAHNMCIVGNPNIPQFNYNNEVWNLGKLPHAKREAESVAHIMKTTPILEAQATKSAVVMRIMNAKVIHLATHGSASAGFLAFGMLVPFGVDAAANPQGVLLYPEEVEKLNISPALVVLSSCDSGRGTVKADGIQGMARAFILAGAQAVLTTLWRVPDESASVFMQFFYQFMMDGLESTKALQKATLSIRCFSKYSQYIHWSGYQLTGRDIYLKYSSPEETLILEKRLGKSNAFPCLQDVKLLESNIVEATCHPTDIQILAPITGFAGHEIVIDFIHNSYNHFGSGIYWINCQLPEFITESVKNIEKIIEMTLEELELTELKQCLLILDGLSELPTSESLLQLMKNRYCHCIALFDSCLSSDPLVRAIDHELVRGCKVHHLEPLSMIQSTQRIVYSVQQVSHFCPNSMDQAIFEKISKKTSGSPVLVNIVACLLTSSLGNVSEEPRKVLENFEESLCTNFEQCKSPSDSSSSERSLSSSVHESLSSIGVLSLECRDEWDTPGSYDSWDTLTGLLEAGQFNIETKLLLDCLSHLGSGPIPVNLVSSLSTLITRSSGKTHLAGSLLDQLMDKGFVKLYPSPVVFHADLKKETDVEFVYVPKYIGDYFVKNLDHPDKAVALSVCYRTLSDTSLSYSSIVFGLLRSLIDLFGLNSDEFDNQCYSKVYQLYLSRM